MDDVGPILSPSAQAWSSNGFLRFAAVLPFPSWDKNDRYVPNCIRRESKADGGRLYIKPGVGLWKLGPKGVAYRAQLSQIVRLARNPWFIPGVPWWMHFEHHGPGDVDHLLHGVLDDLCAVGLSKSDRDCKRRVVDVYDCPEIPLQRVVVTCAQEIPK